MLAMTQSLARSGGAPYGLEAMDKGFEVFLRSLFAKESEHRAESDAAVRQYIRTGVWSVQNPWAEYITFLRVQCAAEFVCQLTIRDHSGLCLPFPCAQSHADVLTWLLLDHWERCFDVYLKLVAVSLFYSLPFYGLTPAKD
jgi:hypothetical protein